MDGVAIRMAQPNDAGAMHTMLAEMAEELGYGAQFASTEAHLRHHGFGPQARFSTVLAETESPIGLALYFPHFSTMRGQTGAYVQDLWTVPHRRGQGIGARLLAAVAHASRRDWGAAYMALSVHTQNAAASQFYAKIGFEDAPDGRPLVLSEAGFTILARSRKATP